MSTPNDTICALATPNGIGAIGMIRISGPGSVEITDRFFSRKLEGKESHTVHFGNFRDQKGNIIDEVLVTLFLGNRSFTGEESVEISAHGSAFILSQIMKTLIQGGCRTANPGEFTLRAFLNGKMDLSQAEAVADLIASQSKNAHDIALKQMRGAFSSRLKELREKLIEFASLVELELDFAEEDVEFADRTQLKNLVAEVLAYIHKLINSFELGNAIKNGVPVAIVGAPNTGKSTLLNQLLGEERAIVSNIAGTTRDVIEETINIDGILFRLIDTAGIREGAEEIEAIGIGRSYEKISQANIVLLMSDFSEFGSASEGHPSMSTISASVWASELEAEFPDKKFAVIGNKIDIRSASDALLWPLKTPLIPISAKTGEGIDNLKTWLSTQVTAGYDLENDTIVSNSRHHEALIKTEENLIKALHGLETGITGDFIAMDIRQAMFHLGTITGDISTDDLLGNIFAKFCIGK